MSTTDSSAMLWGQFKVLSAEEKAEIPLRLRCLEALDPKGYIDNGPTALIILLKSYKVQNGIIFFAALTELERLYAEQLTIAAIEKLMRLFAPEPDQKGIAKPKAKQNKR